MKITKVRYGLTANIGNYQSERLDVEAEVQEGENWRNVYLELKNLVYTEIKTYEEYQKVIRQLDEAKGTYDQFVSNFRYLKNTYDEAVKFAEVHGIEMGKLPYPGLDYPDGVVPKPFDDHHDLPDF